MANHKRRRPAKQRAAAQCQCNPHQKALGNQRGGWATREQVRERLTVREEASRDYEMERYTERMEPGR